MAAIFHWITDTEECQFNGQDLMIFSCSRGCNVGQIANAAVRLAKGGTGRVSVLGLMSGGVGGLVAITPAAGYVNATGALFIGMGAAVVCYSGILLRKKFGFDDALGVWAVHGLGGTFGAIATGLFATITVNAAGKDGLLYGGGTNLLVAQIISVVVVWGFAFCITVIILKALSMFMPLRMNKRKERIGADIIQHGESAYYLR